MSDQIPDIKEKCLLSDDIYDYWWVSQGKTTVPSIDDKEDMMYAHEAYKILGFSEENTYNIYKLTATVMHMGNMTKDFVPVGKEEQAEIKDQVNAGKERDDHIFALAFGSNIKSVVNFIEAVDIV